MKVSINEKKVYECLVSLSFDKQDVINFILKARKSPMFASVFYTETISSKLKTFLGRVRKMEDETVFEGKKLRDLIGNAFDI